MLSPSFNDGASAVLIRSRNPAGVGLASPTSPTDSMSPVNIHFDTNVRTVRLHARAHVPERQFLGAHPPNAIRQGLRRDVERQQIYDTSRPRGAMKTRTTL